MCTLAKSEKVKSAAFCGISPGFTLFAIKDIKDLLGNNYLFGNDNL